MIRLHDLSIGYREKNNSKVVAAHINATLHNGRLTCLIGANGIGKSTLLRTLSAFQPPLAGDVTIATDSARETHLSLLTDKERSRLIGVVLTERTDVQNMTVYEIVGLGRSPYTGFWGGLTENDKSIVEESLRLVGIQPLQDRRIHTLSDGERQKTMIAKALAQQTPVIYLDEPTAFLDYPSKVEMLMLLRQLARDTDKTIFLSTHDMELALQIADELWLMDKDDAGTTALTIGTPQQLAADGSLSRFINRQGIRFNPETMSITITNCR